MSIIDTVVKDGVMAGLKLIPTPYIVGVVAAAAVGLFIWGKVWFHNKVESDAQVIMNKYIATKAKDDASLQAIEIKDATKIQIQYVDRVNTITKVVKVNQTVIDTKVPDVKTILSDGWVSAYNSSIAGLNIDPVAASAATPSGVSATEALDTINENNGICQQNLAQLTALQQWIIDTKAEVASQNKKDK